MKPIAYSLSLVLLSTALACSPGLGSLPEAGDDDDDLGDDIGGGPDAAPVASPDAAPALEDDGRVNAGLQAEWKFDTGAGTRIEDVSGVEPRVDFIIEDPLAVSWLPEGGINVTQETIIRATGPATKIQTACVASNQITMEAWIRPAAVNQAGPARIVTYSIDTGNRNFTLGQDDTEYVFRLRTTETNANGTPATYSELGTFNGALQHVVITRDVAQTMMYLDGELAGTLAVGGDFSQWDPAYELALANELTLDRPWRGEIFLAAVYCRTLGPLEVEQNYDAGF